jgi:hypothetical protein
MLAPLSGLRAKQKCQVICQIPPNISSISQTLLTVTGKTTGGDSSNIGDSIDTGEINTDVLNVTTLNASQVISSLVTSFEAAITIMNSFTVKQDQDVLFLGTFGSPDKLFWDSSASTLYIDGDFKVREPFITLYNDSTNNALGVSDANTDRGILFKWYDDDVSQEKLGFFGFDDSIKRFGFKPDVSVVGDVIIGDDGDVQFNTVYADLANDNNLVDLNISSARAINMTSANSLNLTANGNGLDLFANSTDMNLDITNGNFDLFVDGNTSNLLNIENNIGKVLIKSGNVGTDAIKLETTSGEITIDSNADTTINSSSTNIISTETVNDSIVLLGTSGGIDMTTNGFNLDIVNNNSETTISTDKITTSINSSTYSMTFDSINGLEVSEPKTDYKSWIPYNKFDSIDGIWITTREIVSSRPIYYWNKDAIAETAIIAVDLTNPIRERTDKGFKLDRIYISYEIETDSINSITPLFTKKTYDVSMPTNGASLTTIGFTNGNLLSGTTTGEHYRYIDISSSFFINDESVINFELSFDTNSTSVVKFYGIMLHYTQNHL